MATKEQIDGWKSKHGEVFRLSSGGQNVVVRLPTMMETDAFVLGRAEPETTSEAHRTLLRDCVLEPEADELEALFNRRSAIHLPLAQKLIALAGAATEEVAVQGL